MYEKYTTRPTWTPTYMTKEEWGWRHTASVTWSERTARNCATEFMLYFPNDCPMVVDIIERTPTHAIAVNADCHTATPFRIEWADVAASLRQETEIHVAS